MTTGAPTMRIHLWLETSSGVLMGQGRLQLLEYIEHTGSLSAAAKALGMSYRAAWGKIKASEKILGVKLLEQQAGKGSSAQLSTAAKHLISSYKKWLDNVEQYALSSAAEHFGYAPDKYWSIKDLPSPVISRE
ncbi:winged helix-turn-helix domain-containing protein [Halodesulfovibrio aestuarii]|uniref:Molybdate transport system regulatory protein n=2 Tax=Halodesulfovibrio aestuarii TaxID=126333 RepID=A0A8G2CAA5_9BACT|nr:LysR family transcriptional regulator [Halodesulfovibrio aestuarii]SHJ28375.1 molybdate transport system regulatory protein [Halodesulfovibrio aestuarii]